MNRLNSSLLERMAARLSDHDRDEMAIPSYLHKNPALRWMAWRRLEVVLEHLHTECAHRSPANTTLLDFGCGTGVLFAEEAKVASQIYGVDLVLDAAELLLEESGLDVTLVHAEETERIPDHSIDVLIAAEVLEHIEPLGPTLQQFRRWLAPGGRLIVSLPTESKLYQLGRKLAGFEGHYHHSNARSIDRELQAAGFARLQRHQVPLPGPASIYWVLTYAP